MQLRRFDTISQYNDFNNHETLHPPVSVIDFSKTKPRHLMRSWFGFYAIFPKDVKCGDLHYGKNTYGYALVFHPDLLRATSLGQHIHEYSFFSCSNNASAIPPTNTGCSINST